MTARKAALQPENEAPRKTWQGPRGTTNYIGNSSTADSTTALRLQRLRLLGVIGIRAELLAGMAWEGAHA